MKGLRWRASNVMQLCNNWRCGFQWHCSWVFQQAIQDVIPLCPVPRLFVGVHWPRNELSTMLYVLFTTYNTHRKSQWNTLLFFIHLENHVNNLGKMVFIYSSSTSYSRELCHFVASNTVTSAFFPWSAQNRKFDFTITLLMLSTPNFKVEHK